MNGDELRTVAARLIQGALREIDPARCVAETLSDLPELADWVEGIGRGAVGAPERPQGTDRGGRTILVAFGKAATAMTRGALAVLGDRIDHGIVVGPGSDRSTELPPRFERVHAGHPLPDAGSLEAGRKVAGLLDELGSSDRLLVLLSGGGSAMLTLPAGDLTLENVHEAYGLLLRSGLPIERINAVRRVLDDLKGGGMARRAGGASIIGLVLSDIPASAPDEGLDDVASGPLSPSPVTCRDVEILLRRAGLFDRMPDAVRNHLIARREVGLHAEGVPDVRLHPVAAGRTALEGMRRSAAAMGFAVEVLRDDLRGEATAVGRGLARAGLAALDGVGDLPKPACLLAAGEATVTVIGDGVGGPNQETALAAAPLLAGREGILVGSFGTDGVDGPTDAAGGWVDGRTVERASALGYSVPAALARNDAGTVLGALGDLIRTGPTGTNVADVMFVVVGDGASGMPGRMSQ